MNSSISLRKGISIVVFFIIVMAIFFVTDLLMTDEVDEVNSETSQTVEETPEGSVNIQKLVHDYIVEINKPEVIKSVVFTDQLSIVRDGKTYYGAKVEVYGEETTMSGNFYGIEEDGGLTFVDSNIAPFSLDGTSCDNLLTAGFDRDFDSITSSCQ